MTALPARRPIILAVDDKPENLRLLSSILNESEYEVHPVTSGRRALQVAERTTPDLILLDITMPEMDGYEVCRELKSRERLHDVPVIFITALTDTANKLKAFSAGGVDYIAKPFQVDEVLARVRVHVALRQARTTLSENYDRLRQLEQVRDDLANMIVHDMRSPLQAMMMLLASLQRRLVTDTHAWSQLAKVLRVVGNLAGMANDLLDVSRLEEGKLPLTLQGHDVMALAREVAGTFSEAMHPIIVQETDPVLVTCDGAIVRRVLENLISNAVKHTPPGTPISVGTVSDENVVCFRVTDNGLGVPEAARAQIFEKFGVLRTEEGRRYHSAGLGLAFCKLAVQAHGGRIGVENGAEGGSVFWFDLPRSSALS